MAGDSVEATNEGVFLNGVLLNEPYLGPEVYTSSFDEVLVPDGYVFLMSDNRPQARDSRRDGPVPVDDLKGEVVWIRSPLERFGQT